MNFDPTSVDNLLLFTGVFVLSALWAGTYLYEAWQETKQPTDADGSNPGSRYRFEGSSGRSELLPAPARMNISKARARQLTMRQFVPGRVLRIFRNTGHRGH